MVVVLVNCVEVDRLLEERSRDDLLVDVFRLESLLEHRAAPIAQLWHSLLAVVALQEEVASIVFVILRQLLLVGQLRRLEVVVVWLLFENRKGVQVFYLWLLVSLSLKASFVVYLALLILVIGLVM